MVETNHDKIERMKVEDRKKLSKAEKKEILADELKVEDKKWKLNLRQMEFCQLYVSEAFFAHGVDSYVEAYDVDQTKPNWYMTAAACSSKLLKNAKVMAYLNSLLEIGGLSDEFIDKQLLFTATQNADLSAKMQAIKEYNKLKSRVQDRVDLTSKGKALAPSIVKIIKYGEPNPTGNGSNSAV